MFILLGWFISASIAEQVIKSKWVVSKPRLKQHIQIAPQALFLSLFLGMAIYHWALVQASKNEILSFVYSQQTSSVEPEFSLHLISPSWCGNANMQQRFFLYHSTATEGLDDQNPAVRLNSLKASLAISGWFFGSEKETQQVLVKAKRDPDPKIKQYLEENGY